MGWKLRVYLLEVKNLEGFAKNRRESRTPKQIETWATWGDYITIVHDVDEAFRAIGAAVQG